MSQKLLFLALRCLVLRTSGDFCSNLGPYYSGPQRGVMLYFFLGFWKANPRVVFSLVFLLISGLLAV